MRYQLGRNEKAFREHGIGVDAEKKALQMRIAMNLLTRMLDDDYSALASYRHPRGSRWVLFSRDLARQDHETLGRLISKHFRDWWD